MGQAAFFEVGSRYPTFFFNSDPSEMTERLDDAIEGKLEELGFELVELEHAGSRARPVLRLRIDWPDSEPGSGVTLEDCRTVSRALEQWLEAVGAVPVRYVLEVSSPGVERPLVRPRDFERFRGREIAIQGTEVLLGRSRRVEGELLGLSPEADGTEVIRIRTAKGEELAVPRAKTKRVHLVYRWGGEDRGGRSRPPGS